MSGTDGKYIVIASMIAAVASIGSAVITVNGATKVEEAKKDVNQTAIETKREASEIVKETFEQQLNLNSNSIKALKEMLAETRVLNRRLVELYYRKDHPIDSTRYNISGVDHLGKGHYRVHFITPFSDRSYIALANNTAGYVQITKNEKGSIDLISYNIENEREDAEIFFLAYGN